MIQKATDAFQFFSEMTLAVAYAMAVVGLGALCAVLYASIIIWPIAVILAMIAAPFIAYPAYPLPTAAAYTAVAWLVLCLLQGLWVAAWGEDFGGI